MLKIPIYPKTIRKRPHCNCNLILSKDSLNIVLYVHNCNDSAYQLLSKKLVYFDLDDVQMLIYNQFLLDW